MAAIGRPGQIGGGTTQGFYILGPDGKRYNAGNFRGESRLHNFLNHGLVEYWADPPARVKVTEAQQEASWTKQLADDTTVLRVFSRIRPLPEGAPQKNLQIGRDYMWLFADEIRQIVEKSGRVFDLPQATALKIVRFHMLDFVRGEPDRWFLDEIKKMDFKVTRIAEDTYTIHGDFDCESANGKNGTRGMVGTFDAAFTVDLKTMKCTKFRAWAEAEAWGDHRNTSGAPEGKFPLIIGMLDVNDAISKDVPPQQSFFWAEYLNPFKDDMGF
ncbi:MAG: hypothetical protein IH944_01360 [Armatimonadetes bacterium]|nr:hypothetical protein [Armatimonadota bacterium]